MIKNLIILLLLVINSNADWLVKNKFGRNIDTAVDNTYKYMDKLSNDKGIGEYDYRYKFGAHISGDMAYIDIAPTYYEPDGTSFDYELRRFRVYYKGSFFDKKFFHELEYSFTGPNQYKDILLGYKDKVKLLDHKIKYRAKVGNIKVPFGLEGYTSSKYNTFMERSLTDSFSENRMLGGELLLNTNFNKEHYVNLFLGAFENSLDENIDNEPDTQKYALRSTYGYLFGKNHLLSLGASYLHKEMNGENVKYDQRAEAHLIRDEFVSTKVKDVKTADNLGLEALYIYKRYSLQAEYVKSSLDALEDDYTFDAYYLQGSYFLTKHKRKYKFSNSTITKVKTKKSAVEAAIRYSHIDLNDKDETGGTQTDINYGMNFYINSKTRIMVNYVTSWIDSDDYEGYLHLVEARLQLAF